MKRMRKLKNTSSQLWLIQMELKSYSTLIINLNSEELNGTDLLGLGLSLQKIVCKLEKIKSRID